MQVCHNKNFETDRLTLELTEQALPKALQSEKHLAWLQQQGCHLAIDDFGVGDSSGANGSNSIQRTQAGSVVAATIAGRPSAPSCLGSPTTLAADLGMSVVAKGLKRPGSRIYCIN